MSDPNELYDVTIIGAGPTGLFAAFYAGLREMKCKIVDALDEAGGQLTALYPEKFIYDVPGYPRIQSIDLVKNMVTQANTFPPTMCLGERVQTIARQEDGTWLLTTSKGVHRTRTLVVAAGVGAFQSKKLPGPEFVPYEERACITRSRRRPPFAARTS